MRNVRTLRRQFMLLQISYMRARDAYYSANPIGAPAPGSWLTARSSLFRNHLSNASRRFSLDSRAERQDNNRGVHFSVCKSPK